MLFVLYLCALSTLFAVRSATRAAASNQSVDDTSPLLVYTPRRSNLDPSQTAWFSVGVVFANGGSVHTSQDPHADVCLNFTKTALYIFGTRKFDRGLVSVQIDQGPAEKYDAWAADDETQTQVLYSMTGLDNSAHHLRLSNSASDPRVSGHPWMVVDDMQYTVPGSAPLPSPSPRTSGTNAGVVAGATVGGVALVALFAAIGALLVRRGRRQIGRTASTSFAGAPVPELPIQGQPPAPVGTRWSDVSEVVVVPSRSDSDDAARSFDSDKASWAWRGASLQYGEDVYPRYISQTGPIGPTGGGAALQPIPEVMSVAPKELHVHGLRGKADGNGQV